ERIVLSMDVKQIADGKWGIFTSGGRKNMGMDAIEWAITGERLGAGELVVNSMNEDGVQGGYNILLTEKIAKSVNIPVVASGVAVATERFKDIFGRDDVSVYGTPVFVSGEIL